MATMATMTTMTTMRGGFAALIAVLSVLSATCKTTQLADEPGVEWDLILQDGDELSGFVQGYNVWIPEEVSVVITEDTILRAKAHMLIEGNVLIVDRETVGDGFDLSVKCQGHLLVSGQITGGKGFSYPESEEEKFLGKIGGKGSDITLEAPDLLVVGLVTSGEGGTGGVGGKGGDGGDIEFVGRALTRHGRSDLVLEQLATKIVAFTEAGGFGGVGSRTLDVNPGNSGNSGGVTCLPYPDADQYAHLALIENPYAATKVDCSHGVSGITPGVATGRDGRRGRNGANGTEGAPDGEAGADGGDAPSIQGRPGSDGGDGQDCCTPPSTGGNGGQGGAGSDVVGGKGGNGGRGGDAFAVAGVPNGNGGRGGDAGHGGDATGGDGGDGGNGGDGAPAGAAGAAGVGGAGTGGAGGAGGDGGSGIANGLAGVGGVGGASIPGSPGAPGNFGTACAQ